MQQKENQIKNLEIAKKEEEINKDDKEEDENFSESEKNTTRPHRPTPIPIRNQNSDEKYMNGIWLNEEDLKTNQE